MERPTCCSVSTCRSPRSGRYSYGAYLHWCLALLTVCGTAGCNSKAEIRHYKVPKPELVYAENHVTPSEKPAPQATQQTSAPTDRMLGAIVPQGSRTWYFKMTGPMDLVAAQEPAFRQLVQSVAFAGANASPTWKLPQSWVEKPGSGARFATLVVEGGDQPLEVSVSELPMDDSRDSILQNVNRWRRQMQLPPLQMQQLDSETETLSLPDREAVYVNLVGTKDKSGGPPMMGIR